MELNSYFARGKYFFLKIKLKHLAAESRIIREAEVKTKYRVRTLRSLGKDTSRLEWRRMSLSSHRQGIVRNEARATQLAYGLLRGRKYLQIEKGIRDPYTLAMVIRPKIERMVADYGAGEYLGTELRGTLDQRKDLAKEIVGNWLQGA